MKGMEFVSLLLFERGGRVDYNEVQKGVMVFLSGN
jgi:hypothetical protein